MDHKTNQPGRGLSQSRGERRHDDRWRRERIGQLKFRLRRRLPTTLIGTVSSRLGRRPAARMARRITSAAAPRQLQPGRMEQQIAHRHERPPRGCELPESTPQKIGSRPDTRSRPNLPTIGAASQSTGLREMWRYRVVEIDRIQLPARSRSACTWATSHM